MVCSGQRRKRRSREGSIIMPEGDPCNCGSGEPKFALYDARGIFCTYVCDSCESEKRKQFRADIFNDPNYETCEPVEED